MIVLRLAIYVLLLDEEGASLAELQERAFQGQLLEVVDELQARSEKGQDELRLLAFLQQCAGQFQDSHDTLQQVVELAPEDLDSRIRQANCLWLSGHYQLADRSYASLQTDFPGHERRGELDQARQQLEGLIGETRVHQASLARLRWMYVCSVVLVVGFAGWTVWPRAGR